jgi:preprotein translocase subunit SecD
MKRFLALLVMPALAFAQSAPKASVKLAVHILVACASGSGKPVPVSESPVPLCLDRTPFLTQDDVASAEIQVSSRGANRVFLTFREDAAIRELQVTKKNIGNHVAIVLNGKVVASPAISAASRLLYIDGDFTKDQAQALVAAFNQHTAAMPKGAAK